MSEPERPAWALAPQVDFDRPSAARVWDYFLGGSHNFAVDRQVAEQAIAMKPDMPELAQRVRQFLRDATRIMAEDGIDQFLDIGSGIPTVGNVHEIAAEVSPEAKVLYVDHDPVAVAHSEAILAGNPCARIIQGDLRDVKAILDHPQVRGFLDFSAPIGLLLVGVLHFVPDDADPAAIMATLDEALAPGSYLAIQHATTDGQPQEALDMLAMWNANSPEPMYWRGQDLINGYFTGYDLLDPGVVYLPLWRPEPDENLANPERFTSYAAVGRKRH